MVLILERIDKKKSDRVTFMSNRLPEENSLIVFDNECYHVNKIVVFENHVLALVKQIETLKLSKLQVIGVNNGL